MSLLQSLRYVFQRSYYSAMCEKAPNLRCLRLLRNRKHLKFGAFHL